MNVVSTIKSKHGNGRTNGHVINKESLLAEILGAIEGVGGYGSIEVYVQDHHVTQITTRRIRKVVFPADAGIQRRVVIKPSIAFWIPAFAGKTRAVAVRVNRR